MVPIQPTTSLDLLLRYAKSEKLEHFADELYGLAHPSWGDAAENGYGSQLTRYVKKRFLLETTGTEIMRLMDLPYEDRRPDNLAHILAHRMIVKLADLGFNMPASDVYSDPDKAIRVLWNRDDRTVELVFPSAENEAPYLYRSDEGEYQVEDNPTPESILKWIHWVLDKLSPGGIRAA